MGVECNFGRPVYSLAPKKRLPPSNAGGVTLAFAKRYKRLLGVGLFLAVLLWIFQISGLRDHFNLAFIRQLILQHRIGGLILFVLLFSLGNLIHIPGLLFLAAAVLTLDRVWGGRLPTSPPSSHVRSHS
jgi:hypothetical protein